VELGILLFLVAAWKNAWFQTLKPECDVLASNFALSTATLYRCNEDFYAVIEAGTVPEHDVLVGLRTVN
jgi:hypothetical protein